MGYVMVVMGLGGLGGMGGLGGVIRFFGWFRWLGNSLGLEDKSGKLIFGSCGFSDWLEGFLFEILRVILG